MIKSKSVQELFDQNFYLETYQDIREAGINPLDHYLMHGWREGRDPSPVFDTIFYQKTYLTNFERKVCPLIHYAEVGRQMGLVPVPRQRLWDELVRLFDRNYYLEQYPDIKEARIDPLEHYLMAGWREGRNPSPSFDTTFYLKRHLTTTRYDICPLIHYAFVGQKEGLSANSEMLSCDRLLQAAESVASIIRQISFDKMFLEQKILKDFVVPMFSASWYRSANNLPDSVSDIECFVYYLVFGLSQGKSPGPFFDGAYYCEQARCHGLTPPENPENSYLHWLTLGFKHGVSPTWWFDEKRYLTLNPDIALYPEGPLMHFLCHGLTEGRQWHPAVRIAEGDHPPSNSLQALNFINTLALKPKAAGEFDILHKFWPSELLDEIVDRARALDPEIENIAASDWSSIPPWHDHFYRSYSLCVEQLTGKFDNVVLMPFCKLGGADFVGGILANSLMDFGRTLVLRTDQSDWVRPDWFRPEVASVDLSPFFQLLDRELSKRILYEVILHVAPKNVFNVNSRLAFETFETYGARLQTVTNLFAYYFCADRTPEGHEAGYPVIFFANIIPYLKAALMDTTDLAARLCQRYCLDHSLRSKVVVLYTPTASVDFAPPLVNIQVDSRAKRKNPVVLWAGRFDRQKRFDLLVKIAKCMPEVTFKCWGTAVLDPMPVLSDLPPNLIMHPPFTSYEELSLEDCDGVLYTSAWDGLPTILIEFGARGIPIVASAVGGVPELINQETGWPVDANADLDDYIVAIRDMLQNPDERLLRAKALQKSIMERHTRQAYQEKLRHLFDQ